MKTRYLKPLLATLLLASVSMAHAQIGMSVSIGIAPPALPIYDQPAIPGDGYMWTPGYWAWNPNDNDYFWVPGTWVNAPYSGALWTPGYWAMEDNQYRWNRGYWGDHIGYYGGINYGFGYAGVGYQGGYWNHGAFNYNRSVNNVRNVHVTNTYNTRITNVQNSRVSFNGGRGGVPMTASKSEQIINSMPHNKGAEHITERQTQHETMAGSQADQRLTNNHGMPKVAATPQAGSYDSNRNEPGRAEQRKPSNQKAAEQRQPQQRQPEQRQPEQRQPEQRQPEQRHPEPRQQEQRQGAAQPGQQHAEPAAHQGNHPAPEHDHEERR